MESKLNTSAINSYAEALSAKLSNDFFASHHVISGKEILNFSPVKQIDLFVIKNISGAWQKETFKLRSPYFNYEAEEVKNALKDFLNTVSQHIQVNRAHFQPLLSISIKDALLLALSPYDFFSHVISDEQQDVKLEDLRNLSKFIVINKTLFSSFIKKAEAENQTQMSKRDAFAIFNKACEDLLDTPDDFEVYLEKLNRILPLNANDFYLEEKEEISQQIAPAEEAKVAQMVQAPPIQAPKIIETPIAIQIPKEDIQKGKAKNNLFEKLSVQQHTLNEVIKAEGKVTMADQFQRSRIQTIRSVLTINQRYIYANELFKGNTQELSDVLDEIDQCKSLGEVQNLLATKYIPNYQWDMEKPAFQEFIQLINRKFTA